jgi:selenium donor protein
MGGKPLFALNIVGFPDNRLPAEVLKEILRGAGDKAEEAGIFILGGHTIEDTEPKYGMTVTGVVHPGKILRNDTPEAGDALVLTKPLGTGIIATAMKRGLADELTSLAAIRSMSELNAAAAEVMTQFPVHACTDITGFGLLGHLGEMIKTGGMEVMLNMKDIPFLPGAVRFASNNIVPGGTQNNMAFVESFVDYGNHLSEVQKILVNDAQTSGGLLIALPWEMKDDLVQQLKNRGISGACIIGRVVKKNVGKIFLD